MITNRDYLKHIPASLRKGYRPLIDANELRRRMYEAAMVNDSEDQRWDSGCWIRYRLFERIVDEMVKEADDAENNT